jgi:PAS domain S-box-containing protein
LCFVLILLSLNAEIRRCFVNTLVIKKGSGPAHRVLPLYRADPGRVYPGQTGSRTDGRGNNSRTVSNKDIYGRKNVFTMEGGIKVLYVDDEPGLLEIARLFLEKTGNFQVSTATSAQEALESSQIQSYDAIISDYQMPGMDGIAFLKEVRLRYGDIPFILFTGRGREEVVIEAINSGVDFYIQKGGDPTAQFAELSHKVRQAVARKRAEEGFHADEDLLRLFILHAPVALAMFDTEMRYIAVSSRWIADYHLGNSDILGRSHYEIFPELSEKIKDSHRRGLAGEISSASEARFQRQDGSVQYLAWEVRPWYTATNEIGGIIIFSEDITDRKKAEDALRKSEEKYRSFVETSPDMIWEISPQGILLYVSPQVRAIMGYTPEEITGRSLFDLVPEEEKLFVTGELKRLLLQGDLLPTIEVPALHQDGHTMVLEIRPSLTGTTGKREGYRGVAIDITERKRAEADLQKSQYLLSEAMDMAHIADWELDALTGIFTFNDRFYTLYGTTAGREGGYQMPAEVYAREFNHPDDAFMVAEEIAKALSSPNPGYFSVREHRIIRRDGEVRWILVRIRVTKDADGCTIRTHGANQDITDRKRAEEALLQANKKLNLLSGITRHDIVNQLMIIEGFTQLAAARESDPVIAEYLSKIETGSVTIGRQIEFMKTYHELGVHTPGWFRLDETIAKVAGPEVVCSGTCNNIEVFSDPMLEKVFFNLFENAVRHGERVTEISVRCIKAADGLVIIIEDNGVGIPAGEKEKIFGKGFGKNTGLGLFLVKEILSITGITIRETGEPGKGARFEMTVPKGGWRDSPERE